MNRKRFGVKGLSRRLLAPFVGFAAESPVETQAVVSEPSFSSSQPSLNVIEDQLPIDGQVLFQEEMKPRRYDRELPEIVMTWGHPGISLRVPNTDTPWAPRSVR